MFRVQMISAAVVAVLDLLITSPFTSTALAQVMPPEVEWEKTYGGTGWDVAYSVQQTIDGGYIVAGVTSSFGAGGSDVYLVKTDSNANVAPGWPKTFGGVDSDTASSVQQTTDGGYIVAGNTGSPGADSGGINLIKTDANGNVVPGWPKIFGSVTDDGMDRAHSVQQTSDGGYIVAGATSSYDVYFIKTDANGNIMQGWPQEFGGRDGDAAYSVRQTTDGGYVVAGVTWSFGAGDSDIYLIKTDANGNVVPGWPKTFGGVNNDWANSVHQTGDGGYVVAGWTSSFGAGGSDVYLIKTDALGNLMWGKTFGGKAHDLGYSVQQTSDGGYVVAGETGSFGAGLKDVYLIKTDAAGSLLWQNTFGGANYDVGYSVLQTSDGAYVMAGYTESFDDSFGDVYLIKLKPERLPQPPEPPANLTATYSDFVTLTWQPSPSSVDRYRIERKLGCGEWLILDGNFSSNNPTIYEDGGVPSGTAVCYRVSAALAALVSDPTAPACLAVPTNSRHQLKLYDPTAPNPNSNEPGAWVDLFPCDARFQPDHGTAVIVHGWNPPIIGGDQLNGWMRETAHEISLRLNQRANVIAWEWLPEATGLLPPWQNIQPQAEKLANGLKVLYGRTYSGPVHMIGHSMGSLLIVASAEILSQELSVLGVYPPAQLTLLDTPDKATGSTNIDRLIKRLRASGVYVDSYYGCTNISTHHANLWVDVPCFDVGVCDLTLATLPHCHQAATAWYQGSVPLNRAPILRQASSCFADTMLGTLGFGVSILATDPGSPNRHRPQELICPETSTLKFSKLSFCSLLTEPERGIFGLDESSLCLEKFPPVLVAQPPVDVGWYWASEPNWDGTCVRPTDPLSFCLSPKQIGSGGGGQVSEGVVGYSLDFVVDATWDYFSFEYDFQSVAVSATLEVSLLVGESIYPIFQMLADLAVDDEYLESGQLDIRALHGQTMTLQFALHTAEPGGVLSIRDLVFWRDQWNGNRPPVAVAGPDQVIATGEDGLGHFSIDGSASFDPEGESLTYQWLLDGELFTTGQKPKVELPVGVYEIILVVRDPAYQVSADTLRVLVGSFLRGDSNADGRVDISDAINTLGNLFTGAGVVPCADAADANDDGVLDISDAIFTLAFLFLGGSLPPPAPYPAPGVDLTMDALGCDPH